MHVLLVHFTQLVLVILFQQNLDVNLAVNNLLSRDDDDPDDQDEGSESYLPGGLYHISISVRVCFIQYPLHVLSLALALLSPFSGSTTALFEHLEQTYLIFVSNCQNILC